MHPIIKKILDLIDQNNLAEAFEAIEKLNMPNYNLAKMRQEFEGGFHKDVDYISRLKMAVKKLNPAPVLQPVVLLTFAANDLPEVKTEAGKITEIVKGNSLVTVKRVDDLTGETLSDALFEAGSDLLLYHFSGHSGESQLFLNSFEQKGKNRLSRLLNYNGDKAPSIVFLNGCLSYSHVGILTAIGVKAVIATSIKISDKEAALLAIYFYRWFFEKNVSLGKAFESAEASLNSEFGLSGRGLGEGKSGRERPLPFTLVVNPGEIDERTMIPSHWALFVHAMCPQIQNWTLQDFINAL